MTDKTPEQLASAYANQIAKPMLRSMWPSSSRCQIADLLRDAYAAGRASREAPVVKLDCGDNSCAFATERGGMRTNGGCSCYESAGFHRSAIRSAQMMLPEILTLRAQLAENDKRIKELEEALHESALSAAVEGARAEAFEEAHKKWLHGGCDDNGLNTWFINKKKAATRQQGELNKLQKAKAALEGKAKRGQTVCEHGDPDPLTCRECNK